MLKLQEKKNMTTRKTRLSKPTKNEAPSKIPQEELENFFTDPEPSEIEEKPAEKRRVRPFKTGKVFLGEEDMRHFEAYKKYLKEEQGIKDIKHKPI